MSRRRILASFLASLATPLIVIALVTGVSHADPGFRFWSLWTADSVGWHNEQDAADLVRLRPRSVIAWRFVAGPTELDASRAPALETDFARLCPDPVTGPGAPVAVVIDFGEPSDAPPDQAPPSDRVACVRVPAATAGTALAAASAEVRAGEEGLVCGIDGYPAGECAAAVAEQSARTAAPAEDSPQGATAMWPVSLALLVGISAVYALVARRKRSS